MIKMFTHKYISPRKYFLKHSGTFSTETERLNKARSISLLVHPVCASKEDVIITALNINSSVLESHQAISDSSNSKKNTTHEKSSSTPFHNKSSFLIKNNFPRLAGFLLLILTLISSTISAQDIDIALKQSVNNSLPNIGEPVEYTIYLVNQGNTKASGIQVNVATPLGAISTPIVTAQGGTNTYSGITGMINWTVDSLAGGDSLSLTVSGNATTQGVFFNVAEIVAANEFDIDSDPNNGKLNEDDISTSCFSVPITWYPGDEYNVSIPPPYKSDAEVTWFKDGSPITGSTNGATVNADTTLTIASPGSYTFETTSSTCPATGCCPIIVEEGPYGSIGNYVWQDTNSNGAQDSVESPISGVKVYLLDNESTIIDSSITNGVGFYLFDSLITGQYRVQFNAPTSTTITSKGDGTDDVNDSDANVGTGLTDLIGIDTSLPSGNIGRDNSDVDAGILPAGDFDLNLNKYTISTAPFTAGSTVTFGLTVANEGDLNATLVRVADSAPTGLTIQDNNWSLISGKLVNNTPFSLAAGSSTTLNITFLIDANFTGTTIQNSAEIYEAKGPSGEDVTDEDSSPNNDSSNEDDDDIQDLPITQPVCENIVTISATDDDICVGDTTFLNATSSNLSDIVWYYTSTGGSPLFITSSGANQMVFPTTTATYYGELTSVAVNCPNPRMPVVVTVNARPATPSNVNVIEACTGGTINLNDYIINTITTPGGVFEFHVGSLASSALVADATAVGAGTYYLFEKSGAGCYSNPTAAKVIEKACTQFVDISLIKVANLRTVNLNDIITYTISVSNSGPDIATNVSIEDKLPTGLSFVSSSDYSYIDGTLKTNIPSIGVNQLINFTYQARVTGLGTIINVAEVTSVDQTDVDSTPGNAATLNEDDDDDEVINVISPNPLADLSLQKLVSDSSPSSGDLISYTIIITNSGPSVATNVEIHDALPAGLNYVSSAGADSMSFSASRVVAVFNSIAVNATVQFTINTTVTATNGTRVTNRAEVMNSDQDDPDSTPGNGTNEDDDDTVDIDVNDDCNPTTPIISSTNNLICLGQSTTLTAIGCNGLVEWSSGRTSNSITVSPAVNTSYTAHCQVGTCESPESNIISIIVSTPTTPSITASKNNICAGETVTLTNASCNGVVNWSNGMTGTSINVTPSTTTSYTATCSIGTCVSSTSNSITITVGAGLVPTLTASSSTICNGSPATLTLTDCSGTISWSTGASSASITVTPTETTTYSVTCGTGTCSGTAFTTITVGSTQTPTITASENGICAGESITLTAAGCFDGISWSNGQTTTAIDVNPTTTTTYTATCGGTCGGNGQIEVSVLEGGSAPTISASQTQLCEARNVTITATGCNGIVNWSNAMTGESISVNITANTSITATCSNGTCVSGSSNTLAFTIGAIETPTITSSGTQVCAGSGVSLTASGCAGTVEWSDGQTGTSVNVSPIIQTTYTVICKSGTCTSGTSNAIMIETISSPNAPVISCSASRICPGESITLNGLGCEGTVKWSTGVTGSSIIVTPNVTTVYTATCMIGSCESAPSAPATINVGNPFPPQLSCQNTLICLGASTSIKAQGCVGTVVWSSGQIGPVITVSPSAQTSYSAICDGGTCESDQSNVVTIGISGNGITVPTVTSLTNVCPAETVSLSAAVTSGVTTPSGIFVFRTGNSPNSPSVQNPTVITSSGTFFVFEEGTAGCYSPGAQIDVGIIACELPIDCVTNPAVAIAGVDTTICGPEDFFQLNGLISGTAQAATWTTSGTGTFDNSLNLGTKYNYSLADVNSGSVLITLTTNDPDGSGTCVADVSSFTLTINAINTKPTIATSKSPIICLGDSVILTVNENAASFLWSTGDTTKSIVAKTPGNYTVKLIDGNGCGSLSSDILEVSNLGGIASPSVNDMAKNVCPATSVDLNANVLSTPTTNGGAFEFHTSISYTSPMIGNVSTMPAGDYYVFEKSSVGCYSTPSQIKVIIDDCNTTTTDAEVGILIVGNKSSVSIGDEVIYTITVTNNGPATATNIIIENLLPTGIEIVGATPGLTPVGNKLNGTVASLANGSSEVYVYTGKIIKTGVITNTVEIVAADQSDPIKSNNISSYSVECSTCQEICIATALKADTVRQSDGTYNVKFTSLISNCGNVNLTGVALQTDMANMFGFTATYTMIQQATVNTGSLLVPNVSYNGKTDLAVLNKTSSELGAAAIDTITWVINLVPNGTEGPYNTNAFASGIGLTIFNTTSEVSDVSNDGLVIDKVSAEPTVVKLFKTPSIGLALAIVDTVRQFDGSLNVTYQALVKNNGALTLSNVRVKDTLSTTYKSPVTYTMVGAPTVNIGSSLVPNTNYNGNSDSDLTLASSTMAIGATDTIRFVVNVSPNDVKLFVNQASAEGTGTTSGGTQKVVDVSNTGYNPDAPGTEPTSLTIGNTDDTQSVQTPCIGLALYVADTTKLTDGSFDITYYAIMTNCGNVNLTQINLCDTLASDFASPSVVTLKSAPSLGTGSTLAVNSSYDGVTNVCLLDSANSSLAPNKTDTLKWTINLTLNSNNGPFRKNVEATGKAASGTEVSDVSNDGTNPAPSGDDPTVLNFNNLAPDLIGISKELLSIQLVEDKIYDVVFKFNVENFGIIDFTKVQVQDNISQTFGNSVSIDSVAIFDVSAGFTANTGYTGKGILIDLLVDTLSTLPTNTSASLSLLARVNMGEADTTRFENMALAIGYQNGSSTDDLSNTGSNPDPDADGTPENNSIPTLIDFGTVVGSGLVTPIGIAKSLSDTVYIVDGSYQITYTVIVKNYANETLSNVQISDALSTVFADSTDFVLVDNPVLASSGNLKLNANFDGITDFNFLESDSSSLAPGKSDTLIFKVKVRNNSSSGVTYHNTILGSAQNSTGIVTDVSNEGLNPDSDGDNNPGNNNNPTAVTLKSGKNVNPTNVAVSIQGGISPNNDGINDNLVISGISSADSVSFKIFDRWGELVFKTDNYKLLYPGATEGWNGVANTGIRLTKSETTLPDGTYFYRAESPNGKLWDGKPYINFITIAGGTKK
ncbi:MAG: putative repeat protein (TIGR01451 family)/gliding motility-associated-like protein [Arcticibacterium sp.]|jgi:uncharacterized repeat protein (TIGR01451 family)/gliding motility-associated-like protein